MFVKFTYQRISMKLTPEILKSFESSYVVQYGRSHKALGVIMKYNGLPFTIDGGKLRIFADEGAAKRELLAFVKQTFWQGEYWQKYKSNVKTQTGYDIDMTATIKILPQYGLTSRFEAPENKKMFKEFRDALLKEGIVTIEKITA